MAEICPGLQADLQNGRGKGVLPRRELKSSIGGEKAQSRNVKHRKIYAETKRLSLLINWLKQLSVLILIDLRFPETR